MQLFQIIHDVINCLTIFFSNLSAKGWIPFIIFLLGYFLTWRKSQIDKRDENIIYRNLFISWVRTAKNRTKEQSRSCQEFADDLLNSKYIDTVPFKSSPLMYERLNNLNFDKAIKAFVFNSTGKDNLLRFNSLIANVNYLTVVGPELKEKYEKSYKSMELINSEFNSTFLKIEALFFRKVSEVGQDTHHSDARYIKVLNDFRNAWTESIDKSEEVSTTQHTIEKLIKPSLEFIKSSFNQKKGNVFLLEMYDLLNTMILINRKWNVYKKGTSEIFRNYGEAIELSYGELEKDIDYFQIQTKLVSYLKIK